MDKDDFLIEAGIDGRTVFVNGVQGMSMWLCGSEITGRRLAAVSRG